jgi:hypothetical protein
MLKKSLSGKKWKGYEAAVANFLEKLIIQGSIFCKPFKLLT